MDQRINEIDERLTELLAQGTEKGSLLHEAGHYLLLAPGKRIRPLIVLAITEMWGGEKKEALTAAAALEMVHTYSLIHDDLPCMDDDDMRRGKPTLHRVYGEATAILVGDFLLTYAFEVLAHHMILSSMQKIALITTLAKAAGGKGMVAGQILDIQASAATELLHELKTAALFQAAFCFGAIIALQPQAQIQKMGEWGRQFGLLFQLKDDLEDGDHPEGKEAAEKKAEKIAHWLREEATHYPNQGTVLLSLLAGIYNCILQ